MVGFHKWGVLIVSVFIKRALLFGSAFGPLPDLWKLPYNGSSKGVQKRT